MEVLIARTHFILGMFLVLGFGVQAQEFFVDVKVQAPKVQTNDRQVFTNLETSLRNFVNQQAWS